MAFHFSLQSVYHLRQSIEHQQELRLRTANQQVARIRHRMEQIDQRIGQLQLRSRDHLSAGTTAAELRFGLSAICILQTRRQELERELIRFSNLRDRQQHLFEQARRERDTFETLRKQQSSEYEREKARGEQRQLDDLFLLRRNNPSHG